MGITRRLRRTGAGGAAAEQRGAVPFLLPSGELGKAAMTPAISGMHRTETGVGCPAMSPRWGNTMGSSQTASILRREPDGVVLELELHHGRGGSDRSMRRRSPSAVLCLHLYNVPFPPFFTYV